MQANYSNIMITLLIIKFIRLVTNVVDDYVLIIT